MMVMTAAAAAAVVMVEITAVATTCGSGDDCKTSFLLLTTDCWLLTSQ
jgi:hypothetical protein